MNHQLSHLLIRPNVISENGLKQIMNHIKKSRTEEVSVFDAEKSNETGETRWQVRKEVRDTQIVPIEDFLDPIYSLMKETVKNIINPFYEVEVAESEIPQILSYKVGGHYKPHIDAEALWKCPDDKLVWKKSVDRDISIIFFLNDEFEGGDLVFPELRIRIKPEPGMLVCFPSNHHYLHGVEPVTKGHRYSIVTWATVKGFLSMEEQNKQLSGKYGISVTN
jgi:predicted 2-oxoglutarate/Fe(II)-dependent dioxygenase YbiX